MEQLSVIYNYHQGPTMEIVVYKRENNSTGISKYLGLYTISLRSIVTTIRFLLSAPSQFFVHRQNFEMIILSFRKVSSKLHILEKAFKNF